MARSLIPISVIASDCCGDINDSTYKYRLRFTREIIDGYRQLHTLLLGAKETQTEVLPYDNAISLKCDFMLVSKVGVRRTPGGTIAILYASNSPDRQILSDTATTDYLNSIWNEEWIGTAYPFFGGSVYGELYGMGRTVINNGTYYVDKARGILYIGSNIPPGSEIIVEYVSDGISSGLSTVPMEMKECLKYYAKMCFYSDKNPNLSQMNETRYKKKYNSLKSYYQHQTPLQIAVAVNESISPTNF